MNVNTWANAANDTVETKENIKNESSSLLTRLYKDFANELTNAKRLTAEQKTANIDNFILLIENSQNPNQDWLTWLYSLLYLYLLGLL